MPVSTNTDAPTKPPPASHPSQKSMTKAERRELQERQRAAKLLQKQAVGATSSTAGALPSSPGQPKAPPTPSYKKSAAEINGTGVPKPSLPKDANTSSPGVDDGSGGRSMSRGLRIFSHFGLPKAVGHTIKGDIHPAIIRLGLLFSEFRICGANARCIATLTAFKNVRTSIYRLT